MSEPSPELVEFCRAEYRRLVAILSGYVGEVMVAEELAQETLIRVVRRWRRVASLESPSGFAYRVAMNLATSHLRRRRVERRARARLVEPGVGHEPDGAGIVALRDELARLPEPQRRALVLRHVAGLTVPETAEALGVSEEAVRSRCKRGLGALRDRLGGHRQPRNEVASDV